MTSKAAAKQKERIVGFCRAALAGVFLFSGLSDASPKDDTAYITLQLGRTTREGSVSYTVRAGDSLGRILRRELGHVPRDLGTIRELNPRIRDINRIYPGQTIILPPISLAPVKEAPPARSFFYRVAKGDSLGAILKKELNLTGPDLRHALQEVKKFNPDLKNIHNIYPGQQIHLPGIGKSTAAASMEAPPEKKTGEEAVKRAPPPLEETLKVLETILERMEARLIREGSYHIPLREPGSFTIDNAIIPMIEFADGSVAFMDFRQRIPEEIRQIITRNWQNHGVISPDAGHMIPFILEKIFAAKESYQFKRLEQPLFMGVNAQVQLQADWLISWPRGKGSPPGRQALIFLTDASHLLPPPILRFAEKTGLIVTEVLAGRPVPGDPQLKTGKPIPSLEGNSAMEISRNFLKAIGLTPREAAEVTLFESAKDGFKLSITADLQVSLKNRQILLFFRPLPGPLVSQLAEKGFEAVTITEGTAKTALLEKVVTALQLPHSSGTLSFSLPGKPEGQVNAIAFPGLRVLGERGDVYLINFDLDPDLYTYLQARWRLNLIRY